MRGGDAEPRAADGLTEAELRRGRAEWWDADFTALLTSAMPPRPRRILEIGCGQGQGAAALLAALPAVEYLALDLEAVRVAACREATRAAQGRIRLLQASALALPLAPASVDAVLCVSTLMHLAAPAEALAEARRVLRPGGRMIAVEPDNRVQLLRFDGPLPELQAAFEALFARLFGRPAPPDLELGPRLPALFGAAGFVEVGARAYLLQSLHEESAESFLDRLGGVADTVAASAGLDPAEPAVRACREALARARTRLAGRRGFGLHAVPVWRVTGVRARRTAT